MGAGAAIWAHTAGYTPRLRGDIALAFLRAFVDDSAANTGDQRLFLAGYLNTADNWERFAVAWDEELCTAPSIDYLKMAEAQNLRDQFDGWSQPERDKKLFDLARVICHFKPFSFQFSVNRTQYYELVRPVSPRGFGNPHFIASFGAVSGLARFAASQKIKTPIDFIFDQQDGVDADIGLFFEYMTQQLPRSVRRLITGTPIFRDDKQFLPLQAADMLAWHVRREHEFCTSPETMPMADLLRCEKGHLVSELPKPMMESWSKQTGLDQYQSRRQWRTVKQDIARLSSIGFIPPYGSRWQNTMFKIRLRLARLFR